MVFNRIRQYFRGRSSQRSPERAPFSGTVEADICQPQNGSISNHHSLPENGGVEDGATGHGQESDPPQRTSFVLPVFPSGESEPLDASLSPHQTVSTLRKILDTDTLNRAIEKTEQLYNAEEWEQTVDQCRVVLELDPSHAPTHKRLGNTFLQLDQRHNARSAYQQALVHDPEFADVYVNLGNLEAQDQQWDEAIAHYQQAIALNPDFAGAYRNLAKVWRHKGNERLATECLFHAIEREPDSLDEQGYFTLGNQLLAQGQPKQAIHCYRYLLPKTERSDHETRLADGDASRSPFFEQHPIDLSILHQNLAEALAQTDQWQEAVGHYQQAQQVQLQRSPLNSLELVSPRVSLSNRGEQSVEVPPFLNTATPTQNGHVGLPFNPLAVSHRLAQRQITPIQEDTDQAHHPNNGLALAPNPSTIPILPTSALQTAQGFAKQGKWDQVLTIIKQELEAIEPDLNQHYELLAKALRIEGDLGGAMESYKKMLMLYPNQAKPFANLGSIYAQQEQWQEAKAAYQQAIQLDPNFAGAYRNLARVWQSTGNEEAAADCWVKAYELEPDWGTASEHLDLSQIFIQRGNVEGAIAALNRAVTKDDTLTSAHFQLAELHRQRGTDELAIIHYGKALQSNLNQSDPHHCDAIYALGQLLVVHGDEERAFACFQKLVQSEPNSIRGYSRLREILVSQGRLNEAIPCYQRLAEFQPNNSMAHHELGDMFNRFERWSEAIPAFRRAVELDPNFSWSHNNLGDALLHMGDWTEARDALETAIALNPDCFWSYHNLGKAQNELGNWPGAVVALQEAIALDPSFAWSHFNLGIALAQIHHVEEAIAAYRQAQQLDPTLDGLHGKIIEVLQQRIKEQPRRIDLYLDLAEEWLDGENVEDAIATYQMALHLAPHNRTVALALAQLLEQSDGSRSRSLRDRALIPQLSAAATINDPKQLQDLKRVKAVLAATSLFDASYYRSVYHIAEHDDPFEHYLTQGAEQGDNPNPLFDSQYYGQNNPEIDQLDINPLAHYYIFGRSQQHNPHPLFSHERYLENNPDVAATDLCPLDHYLSTGAKQGRIAFGRETLEYSTALDAPYLKCLPSFRPTDVTGRATVSGAHKTQQCFGIFCNSGGNYFITEIADHIATSLEHIGHRVLRLSEIDAPPNDLDQTIIVAPHEFFFIGEQNDWVKQTDWWTQAIMVNVEQPQTQWFSKAFHFLRRSRLILDINVKSAALLHSFNLPVQWLPLGYLERYDPLTGQDALPDLLALRSLHPTIRSSRPHIAAPLSDRPLDLNFVGVLNRRRELFFAQNAAWLSQYRNLFHIPSVGDPLIAGQGQALDTNAVIGLSRRSKILLNIHRDDVPYFEWHRIVFHGLWQNTLVVTEPCHDLPGLVPNVHFSACEWTDMQDKIHWLLNTPDGQAQADAIRWAGHTTLQRLYPADQIIKNAVTFINERTEEVDKS